MQYLRVLGLSLLGALTSAFAVDAGGQSCWVRGADAAADNVYLLCDESHLLVSEDYGMSWAPRPLPENGRWRAVKFLDARRGYVAGDKGTLISTTDGGYNWQPVALPTGESLTAIAWKGESGWIAGYGGVILHTGDGGRTWTLQNSRVSQPLDALFFADEKHGWAVGWVGTITRTTDGGHSWEKVEPPSSMIWSLSSVYFRDPKNGWAVGFSGEILRSRDGGATWEVQASPVEDWLTAVVFDSSGRGWIVGDPYLLVSEDGGETWQATQPTEDGLFLSRLLRTDDSLWVIGQYGVLKRSPDNVAWRQLEAPTKLVVPPSRYQTTTAATRPAGSS